MTPRKVSNIEKKKESTVVIETDEDNLSPISSPLRSKGLMCRESTHNTENGENEL
jgi:hypothetical protein